MLTLLSYNPIFFRINLEIVYLKLQIQPHLNNSSFSDKEDNLLNKVRSRTFEVRDDFRGQYLGWSCRLLKIKMGQSPSIGI
jgi:hypothetical protein